MENSETQRKFMSFDMEWYKIAQEQIGRETVSINQVLCIISGPVGSGKTTLLEKLNKGYPMIMAKDLDDFDDQAKEDLTYDSHKKNWTPKMLHDHFNLKKALMNEFIRENVNANIVFGGVVIDGGRVLTFRQNIRFCLILLHIFQYSVIFIEVWRSVAQNQ